MISNDVEIKFLKDWDCTEEFISNFVSNSASFQYDLKNERYVDQTVLYMHWTGNKTTFFVIIWSELLYLSIEFVYYFKLQVYDKAFK